MIGRRALLALGGLALAGCPGRDTVLVKFSGEPGAAHVYINDRFVARLDQLSRSGIKLEPGEYRVTVKEIGYFPQDQLVTVNKEKPPAVQVELTKIPD